MSASSVQLVHAPTIVMTWILYSMSPLMESSWIRTVHNPAQLLWTFSKGSLTQVPVLLVRFHSLVYQWFYGIDIHHRIWCMPPLGVIGLSSWRSGCWSLWSLWLQGGVGWCDTSQCFWLEAWWYCNIAIHCVDRNMSKSHRANESLVRWFAKCCLQFLITILLCFY